MLWIQEQEAKDRLPLVNACGKINPADLMTKHVEGELIKWHMKTIHIGFRESQSQLAAQLYGLGQGGEGRRRTKEEENSNADPGDAGNRGTSASEGEEERRGGDEKGEGTRTER